MSKMSTHSKCQKYQNIKYIKSQIPQKPLHVTLFPSSLPSPRHRYMWHLSPGPSQTTETVSPCPSQTTETVTCDTFSLVLPKPQKPLHVTPFPLSRPNPRNRYMWHLFPDPSKAPETVTCNNETIFPQLGLPIRGSYWITNNRWAVPGCPDPGFSQGPVQCPMTNVKNVKNVKNGKMSKIQNPNSKSKSNIQKS